MNEIKIASRWLRLGAFLLDISFIYLMSFAIVTVIYSLGFAQSNNPNEVWDSLTIQLVSVIYFPIFTFLWSATPGKRILKMKVVATGQEELTKEKIILREVFGRWISIAVFGHLWILFNKNNKTAWDMLANTLVIKT